MSEASKSGPTGETTLPPAPRPRRWLRVVMALVLFASGFVVGAGATLITVRNRVLHAIHHPEEGPPRVAAKLRRKLDLTDEQTRRVEEILRARQLALQAIRREAWPRVEVELDRVRREVAEVLDEQQRREWEERFAYLRETWIPPVPE
jgi:hypothetical protein